MPRPPLRIPLCGRKLQKTLRKVLRLDANGKRCLAEMFLPEHPTDCPYMPVSTKKWEPWGEDRCSVPQGYYTRNDIDFVLLLQSALFIPVVLWRTRLLT